MRRVVLGIRCTLIGAWVAASLVAWLFVWAAINAPPVFGMLLNTEAAPARLEIYTGVLACGWIIHGVVYFMLISMKSMHDAFEELKRFL